MLDSIPTILLLIFVYFYLKSMLFTPLKKVLSERDALTLGARKAAQESLAAAERKQREYEQRFAEARLEIYKAQEAMRREWLEDQAAQVGQERVRLEGQVHTEKEKVAQETMTARDNLTIPSAELAVQIADSLLSRRAGSAA